MVFFYLAQGGFKVLSRPVQLFVEFLWSFTDNMVVRFEPFLVFLYLWLMNTHLIAMSPERRKREKQGESLPAPRLPRKPGKN